MHVDALEPGLVERGGHLDLAVHALLAQDRHTRAPHLDQGRGDIVVVVEAQSHRQPGVLSGDPLEFLAGTLRIITQRLHMQGGLRPGLLQLNAARCIPTRAMTDTISITIPLQYRSTGSSPPGPHARAV